MLLIHNTIRLALFSQRFLIRSMQLIGAKSSFIRGPFLVRALILGLIAGLIAYGLLYVIIAGLDYYLNDFDIEAKAILDLAKKQAEEMLSSTRNDILQKKIEAEKKGFAEGSAKGFKEGHDKGFKEGEKAGILDIEKKT